ncbi:Kef-type K+ transport system membrane component KefB [Streptomyces sp. LBL]|uniref:cation:proton antiporter n=1 Tax=Streptomyces sp. LBL TaxID=2940562 RepID=UPI0024747CEE|nr:cation:proton antiporter [Streptomyces sp. LBL]MDH6625801.1 Kef-type K+ transport system membrane component KefB [Streptomyces sp. LBL]
MSPDTLVTHFLLASALILAVGHGAGWLARRLKQPYIVGQLAAGIALGPSLLGSVAPGSYHVLFPKEIGTALTGLAQFGLVIFLFAVGYELDLKVLGDRARTAVTVALVAFLVPMAVGSGAALLFREQLRALDMPHLSPAMVVFAGVALSITAVPVLTAIVRENGLASTVPGVLAVSAAGLLDVIGWTVLAGTLLDGGSGERALGWPWRAALAVGFTALMLVAARPLLRRLLWTTRMEPSLRLALLIGFAFASACFTQFLGLHAICGALLAGVVCPREQDGTLDPDLLQPLHVVSSLLLPFFFVYSGQSVALNSMTATGWSALLVVTVLAVVTKIGSGTVAARLGGLDRDDARTVGVLLSARGLTELIALNAGLQAGLLSEPFYTVLVFMALTTTLLTQPLLILVRRLAHHEQRRLADGPGTILVRQHPTPHTVDSPEPAPGEPR